MTFLPLGSLKPLSTPDMPNKTIYWPPVLYLRDLLGNWLVRELGVCAQDHPLGANSASESQQSCLDLPVAEVKQTFGVLLFRYLILSSSFRSGVVDASSPPSFSHFSFQRVGLQIDGEQSFLNLLVIVQGFSLFSENQS